MRTKIRLLLLLMGTYVFINLSAQPLVYTVENTGTSYPAPPLPTLANCPTIQYLPDPFKWADGSGSSTAFSDWEHHRNDFRAQIENYEIGTKPAVDKATQVTASYSGNTLTINITANGQSMTMTCAVSIPSGATAPYPVCIGMNSSYGSVTSSDFTSRGIVGITFSHDQVTTYGSPANTNPFFKLYPTQNIDNTGQYAAWAWGISRIIDGLEKVKAAGSFNVDLSHICVTGCSYAGKMALFSGAFDERIALTIAQESGGGGATSWRYSATEPSGTVEGLAQTDSKWFKNSMFDFGGANVTKLPDDHHELMAMCAPRALYCTGNTDYTWLSNPSCYVCGMATKQIYSTLGIADRFGFNVDGGHSHCAFPSDQESEVQYFLNKFIKGQTNLSQSITTHPSSYSSIDYAKWYSNWGPYNNTPVTGVSVSPTTASVNIGATSQLTATVSPSNATNKSVTWSTSSSAIATVSSTGLVTGVASGAATITVTTVDGAKTATATITVNNISPVSVTGVTVSPTTASINVGATSQLTATVSPSNATNKSVTWSTSSSAIATVSSTGLVTGVASGAATITVTTVDGAKTATATITVNNIPPVSVTGVSVSPTTASVNVGATSQLTATVSPSNATNKSVTWSTSSSAIATVSSTGLVTGVATGAATITVTTVDGAKTATCAVTVTSNNGPCTFGTPTAAALPSDAKSYNYVYVLGTGGPNLSNVSNFTINWDLPNKGLYQFSMNTKDGKPNWYVDLRTGATQTFASAQPAITLSGTGFTGLDGGYNATVYNGDFVLVSKTGSFTIYFSNSATAPTCVKSAEVVLSAAGIENNEVSLYPNPFNVSLNLAISRPELVNNVFVVDQMGRVISRLEKSQISSMNVIGSKLSAGIYFIKIVSSDNANTYQVIKR